MDRGGRANEGEGTQVSFHTRTFWSCCGLAVWLPIAIAAAAGAAEADGGAGGAPRRVRVTLSADGELHGPASGATEPARQAIAMEASFDFLETLASGPAEAAVQRRYREAAARLDVGDDRQTLALPPDARSIAVARLGTTPQPFLPQACLSRDELELLETPFDSLLLEDLLPGRPVVEGDRWPLAGDVTAGLLAIDTVETGTLQARIVEVADGVARIALEGGVDGAVDGVPTHVNVDGEFTVAAEPDEDGHALVGDVTRLDAVVRERRQAGHVAAGFEIEARVAVTRTAADADEDLADPAADEEPTGLRRRGPGGPGRVWYRDAEGRYDLVHDSGWRCVEEDAGGLVLRLIDLGALVAQCSITALPRSEDAVVPSLDEVKRHVEQSLAGQFKRFDGATETVRPEDGVRVVRVVSEGNAEGLPFRWVHYVLTDDAGHRVNAAFMVEASLERRFGDADARLVAGLRLAPDARREAGLPRKTEVP